MPAMSRFFFDLFDLDSLPSLGAAAGGQGPLVDSVFDKWSTQAKEEASLSEQPLTATWQGISQFTKRQKVIQASKGKPESGKGDREKVYSRAYDAAVSLGRAQGLPDEQCRQLGQ